MLFSTTSGVSEAKNKSPLYKKGHFEIINKYYIQKFLKPSNVLMVASQTGFSLKRNFENVTSFLAGTPLLTEEQMEDIEEALKKIRLAHM